MNSPTQPEDPTIVQWHASTVARSRGCVVWFTGLSGSGKSTVANCVDAKLNSLDIPSFVLDGDNIRHGLNASPQRLARQHGTEFAQRFGLTFTPQDREENIRRIGCVAEIFCSAGIIVLTAFVSPYRRDRKLARELVTSQGNNADFVEVFVDTPLDICESRDPKGLYKKARSGELTGMTGIDDPYEIPDQPELILQGAAKSVGQLADDVIGYLKQLGKIRGV